MSDWLQALTRSKPATPAAVQALAGVDALQHHLQQLQQHTAKPAPDRQLAQGEEVDDTLFRAEQARDRAVLRAQLRAAADDDEARIAADARAEQAAIDAAAAAPAPRSVAETLWPAN